MALPRCESLSAPASCSGLVAVTLCAVLVAQSAQAQGSIVGTVRDEQTGVPLPGAIVALTDLDRAVSTDSAGSYLLRQVPAGPNHVSIRLVGYSPRALHALVPPDGQLEINVSMSRAPIPLPTVQVRAPVTIRGSDIGDSAAFPDRSMSIAAVRNHPSLAEPDVLHALAGGEVVMRPESPSGVHIRGGASDHTAYMLDGIPVFSPYHAAGMFSAWNPDALSRVHLSSYAPSPAYPQTLSGVIDAVTRAPGSNLRAQGSVSTTQARFTVNGPIRGSGAGYLISVRSGFPGIIAPKDEDSYLRGETGDWLAKLEAPAFGGRLRLLGYTSENDLNAAAVPEEDTAASGASRRNVFEWRSHSLGAEWSRQFSAATLRLVSWGAAGEATSFWAAPEARLRMRAVRRDGGLLATVDHTSPTATTLGGMRLERTETSYRINTDSTAARSWSLRTRQPIASAFAQQTRALTEMTDLRVAASLAQYRGDFYFAPRAQLRRRFSQRLTLTGSYSRAYQFAQSVRNPESVVGAVFPVDLYVAAGDSGIPVAKSDQSAVAADFRARSGVRVGAWLYTRRFDGLLLVAPQAGEPFTTGPFTVGAGDARGVSIDVSVSRARYGIIGSYGLQRVRFDYQDSSYVPEHGTTHLLESGVIVFPTATASVRLSATAALGRRTTAASSGIEWEGCNLLDRGCEFGGSPYYGGEPLGAVTLPLYLRVDLGARKHWHVNIGRRDAVIALFGTVTNVLGRKNVLTYTRDPSTRELTQIDMRPRSPLVVGLDWQF
jgi:hypothetical protein